MENKTRLLRVFTYLISSFIFVFITLYVCNVFITSYVQNNYGEQITNYYETIYLLVFYLTPIIFIIFNNRKGNGLLTKREIELSFVIAFCILGFLFIPLAIVFDDRGLGIFVQISILYYYIFIFCPIIIIYKSKKKLIYILLIIINIIGLYFLTYCAGEYSLYIGRHGDNFGIKFIQYESEIYRGNQDECYKIQ